MTSDDPQPTAQHSSKNAAVVNQQPWHRGLLAIPPPLKRVFDKFPLVTYDANELPLNAPRQRNQHVLHVFTIDKDAPDGKLSFNPACAKWQAYLKFNDIPFRTVRSSNHASPSGMLPFLIPAGTGAKSTDPIPSNKLKKWLALQKKSTKSHDTNDVRYEVYMSLIDSCIRKAWLFQLYLSPPNRTLLKQLYVEPCSSNFFIQQTTLYQLRQAAEAELAKSSQSNEVAEKDIMRDAEEAFEALSTLLDEAKGPWFAGGEQPDLFDASVFAYTHLILSDALAWKDNQLGEMLRNHPNLVQHQERIVAAYF
ncbi:mitochondrial outer membrane protein (Sam35), protein [Acrodontium crateriforme]|uniref:Mitochondrial outer membrane protein (Sam35), protein n=1 Tax=Acrodontium crateriforme TaxID=150365 RepID=A0AAQ3M7G0_9PEZI|nr:mitochondrial outer membrane protein (Sam35), protein [Acrodontium crateriforme]